MSEGESRLGWRVFMLPGGVLPAEAAYKNLLAELGGDADARIKDLEVYATDRPPPDFSLETEVGGIARVADEAGFDRFHLVGYSGGGASSLAFTAAYPDRVLSLALLEPAWAGNEELSAEELQVQRDLRSLRNLPAQEFMANFARYQLKPGVKPPPPPEGPPPPWMAKRLGGIFPDFTLEIYPGRHHFDPPHRIEPAKVAAALRRLWQRAEPKPSQGSV